jgi:hypothetical protein
MRYSLILLSTCAAICLAVPAVSVADPPQDRNQPDAQHGTAQAAGKGQPQGAHAPAGGQPSGAEDQRGPQGQAGQTGRNDFSGASPRPPPLSVQTTDITSWSSNRPAGWKSTAILTFRLGAVGSPCARMRNESMAFEISSSKTT